MTTVRLCRVALAFALTCMAAPACAWESVITGDPDGPAFATDVQVAADGDPVVCGRDKDGWIVARIDADTGRQLWIHHGVSIPSPAPGIFAAARTVALDSAGDVLVGGPGLTVEKLRGDTGTLLWSRSFDFSSSSYWVQDIVVDPSGDAVVAGRLSLSIVVMRLAATDGATVWQYQATGSSAGFPLEETVALEPDGAGGVVIGGSIYNGPAVRDDVLLARVALVDGSETWRVERDTTPPGAPSGTYDRFSGLAVANGGVFSIFSRLFDGGIVVSRHVASDGSPDWEHTAFAGYSGPLVVDGGGDVLAIADDGVIKVRGSDGAPLWTAPIPGPFGSPASGLTDIVIDANDDVVVSGEGGPSGYGFFETVRLNGITGAVEQVQPLFNPNAFIPHGAATAVVVDPTGARVAVGLTLREHNLDSMLDLVALRTDERLRGRRLSLIDPSPERRLLKFTVKDNFLLAPAPATFDDPTIGGASLELTNPTTLETVTMPLPVAGWSAIAARTPGTHGYRYTDKSGALGPCTSVTITGRKGIVARCLGAGVAFSLDEASQGQIDLVVRFSPGGTRACISFGGVIRDQPGLFTAINSAAPATCP